MRAFKVLLAFALAFVMAIPALPAYAEGGLAAGGLSTQAASYRLTCDLTDGFTLRADTKTFRAHATFNGDYVRTKANLFRVGEEGALTPASSVAGNSYGEVNVVFYDESSDTFELDMSKLPPGEYLVRVGILKYGDRPEPDIVHEYRFTYKKTPAGGCVGTVIIDIEAFTIGLGYIEEPAIVPIYQGENAAQVLDRFLRERGYTYQSTGGLTGGFYLGAITGPAIDATQARVDPTVGRALAAHEDDGYEFDPAGYADENTLGQYDFSSGSGWMYSVNGGFPNVGFSDWTLSDGDVMRVQFTLALGFDLGTSAADGSHSAYYAVAGKDEATEYLARVNSALNVRAILDDGKGARLVEALKMKLADLGSSQQDVDDALDALRYYLEHSGSAPTISLSQSELEVQKNASVTLVPQVGAGAGLAPQVIEWDSSDTIVATVDSDGTVRAHANGEAVITARLGASSARCTVTVYGSALEDFELVPFAPIIGTTRATYNIEKLQDDGTYLLRPGEKLALEAKPIPADAVDPLAISVETSDAQVASVRMVNMPNDGKGFSVDALTCGEADIIARLGSIEHRAHIVVREGTVEGFEFYDYDDATSNLNNLDYYGKGDGKAVSHMEILVGDCSQANHGYVSVCPLPDMDTALRDPLGYEAVADDPDLVDVYLAQARPHGNPTSSFFRLHVWAKGTPGETDVHVRLGTYTRTLRVTVKQAHAWHQELLSDWPYPADLSRAVSSSDGETSLRFGFNRTVSGSTGKKLQTPFIEYKESGIAEYTDESSDDVWFSSESDAGSEGLLVGGDGMQTASGSYGATSTSYTVAAGASGTGWVHATVGAPYGGAEEPTESYTYAVTAVNGEVVPVESLDMMMNGARVAHGGSVYYSDTGNRRWRSVEGKLQAQVGDRLQLTASVAPANASAVPVWASDNQRVATVDPKTGLVHVLAGGDAAIVLACGGYVARLELHASEPVSKLSIGSGSHVLSRGETLALPLTAEPWTANVGTAVTWSSSDAAVATVDSGGIVHAAGYGQATITATAAGGATATCHVTVGNPLSDMYFAGAPYVLVRGDELGLSGELRFRSADGAAADPGLEGAEWSTSDESVATVDASGTVHAVGAGTCTVRVRANGLSAWCKVTVRVPLERLVIPERLDIYTGEQAELSFALDPVDATTATGVSWTNSRESNVYMVVKSNSATAPKVQLTGLKPGVSVVTATLDGKAASCEVHVNRTPAQQAVFDLQTAIRAWVAAYPDPEAAGVDHAAYVAEADEISAMWQALDAGQRAKVPEYGESFVPEAARIERVRAVAACEDLMRAAAGGDESAVAAAQAALAALDAGQQAMVSASATADLQKGGAAVEKAKQEAAAAEKAKQEAAATEKARKEAAEKAANVANAVVTVGAAAYTGKACTPSVKVVLGGRTLKAGSDYTLTWSNNVNAGKSAKVTVKGAGAYRGSKSVGFGISAAKNSVTAKKAVTKKLKANKKTGKLGAKKTFKLKPLAKATAKFGAVTFAKKKGNASIKVSKSGAVTVKKGLKRGTYTVKVQVSAAKASNWSAASKTITVKVVVK